MTPDRIAQERRDDLRALIRRADSPEALARIEAARWAEFDPDITALALQRMTALRAMRPRNDA